MTRLYLILLCTCLVHALQAQQLSEKQEQAIDRVFEEVNRTNMPGCAVAVMSHGTIVYEKGYGMADLERSIAVTPSTVFYAGSISKQFVASCALLLAEEGKLDLDAQIGQFFSDFPSYGRDITILQMIYHISGIKDYFDILEDRGYDYLNRVPVDRVYQLITEEDSLLFQPGEKYSYSNSGYLLLAMIIEQVSGTPLSVFAQEHIFHPLDMKHSMFLDDNRKLVPNRAWGYRKNHLGQIENMIMRFDLVGSGGLYTTVGDLAKWSANFDDPRIGSLNFLSRLLTSGQLNDGSDIKYAFAIRKERFLGREVVGHSGSLGGYRAQFMRFPSEPLTIIILSNLANFKPAECAHKIAKIMLQTAAKE